MSIRVNMDRQFISLTSLNYTREGEYESDFLQFHEIRIFYIFFFNFGERGATQIHVFRRSVIASYT